MDAWKEGHQLSIEALAVSHQFHLIILYDYWHTRSDLLCVIECMAFTQPFINY